MRVIHFTQGATDPLTTHDAKGVRFVPLADGTGESHLSCAHLEPGATVNAPSLTHGAALLVVHGRITVITQLDAHIRLSGGMGAVWGRDEPYSIESDIGAIVLIVESTELAAHFCGVSSPERIAGQTWPSDGVVAGGPTQYPRSLPVDPQAKLGGDVT
jgi:hypothetical protein